MRLPGQIVVCGLVMAASACRGSDAAPKASAAAPNVVAVDTARSTAPVVLFMGTSLTFGLGLDPDSAYPALLQRIADSVGVPARMVNAGLSGETSAGALRRIDWILKREPFDVFVLEEGANDGLRGEDPDAMHDNLVEIIKRVRAARPNARVLLVQMEAQPNFGKEYTARFHAEFPSAAQETGATLVPFLLNGVAGVDTLNQDDGMHPNDRGEHIVARNLWPVVAQALGARP